MAQQLGYFRAFEEKSGKYEQQMEQLVAEIDRLNRSLIAQAHELDQLQRQKLDLHKYCSLPGTWRASTRSTTRPHCSSRRSSCSSASRPP